jgi:hypothetical protein
MFYRFACLLNKEIGAQVSMRKLIVNDALAIDV